MFVVLLLSIRTHFRTTLKTIQTQPTSLPLLSIVRQITKQVLFKALQGLCEWYCISNTHLQNKFNRLKMACGIVVPCVPNSKTRSNPQSHHLATYKGQKTTPFLKPCSSPSTLRLLSNLERFDPAKNCLSFQCQSCQATNWWKAKAEAISTSSILSCTTTSMKFRKLMHIPYTIIHLLVDSFVENTGGKLKTLRACLAFSECFDNITDYKASCIDRCGH